MFSIYYYGSEKDAGGVCGNGDGNTKTIIILTDSALKSLFKPRCKPTYCSDKKTWTSENHHSSAYDLFNVVCSRHIHIILTWHERMYHYVKTLASP